MSLFAFGPASITVAKGSCVTFRNSDFVTHNVHQVNNGVPGIELVGELKSRQSGDTLALTQSLDYICGFHPDMKGTIVVR